MEEGSKGSTEGLMTALSDEVKVSNEGFEIETIDTTTMSTTNHRGLQMEDEVKNEPSVEDTLSGLSQSEISLEVLSDSEETNDKISQMKEHVGEVKTELSVEDYPPGLLQSMTWSEDFSGNEEAIYKTPQTKETTAIGLDEMPLNQHLGTNSESLEESCKKDWFGKSKPLLALCSKIVGGDHVEALGVNEDSLLEVIQTYSSSAAESLDRILNKQISIMLKFQVIGIFGDPYEVRQFILNHFELNHSLKQMWQSLEIEAGLHVFCKKEEKAVYLILWPDKKDLIKISNKKLSCNLLRYLTELSKKLIYLPSKEDVEKLTMLTQENKGIVEQKGSRKHCSRNVTNRRRRVIIEHKDEVKDDLELSGLYTSLFPKIYGISVPTKVSFSKNHVLHFESRSSESKISTHTIGSISPSNLQEILDELGMEYRIRFNIDSSEFAEHFLKIASPFKRFEKVSQEYKQQLCRITKAVEDRQSVYQSFVLNELKKTCDFFPHIFDSQNSSNDDVVHNLLPLQWQRYLSLCWKTENDSCTLIKNLQRIERAYLCCKITWDKKNPKKIDKAEEEKWICKMICTKMKEYTKPNFSFFKTNELNEENIQDEIDDYRQKCICFRENHAVAPSKELVGSFLFKKISNLKRNLGEQLKSIFIDNLNELMKEECESSTHTSQSHLRAHVEIEKNQSSRSQGQYSKKNMNKQNGKSSISFRICKQIRMPALNKATLFSLNISKETNNLHVRQMGLSIPFYETEEILGLFYLKTDNVLYFLRDKQSDYTRVYLRNGGRLISELKRAIDLLDFDEGKRIAAFYRSETKVIEVYRFDSDWKKWNRLVRENIGHYSWAKHEVKSMMIIPNFELVCIVDGTNTCRCLEIKTKNVRPQCLPLGESCLRAVPTPDGQFILSFHPFVQAQTGFGSDEQGFDVFISYAQCDTSASLLKLFSSDLVKYLKERTEIQDPQIFTDVEKLNNVNDIPSHVKSAKTLVALLSKEYLERPWCQVEIYTAMTSGLNVIPVFLVGDCEFNFKDANEKIDNFCADSLEKSQAEIFSKHNIDILDFQQKMKVFLCYIASRFDVKEPDNVRFAQIEHIWKHSNPPTPCGSKFNGSNGLIQMDVYLLEKCQKIKSITLPDVFVAAHINSFGLRTIGGDVYLTTNGNSCVWSQKLKLSTRSSKLNMTYLDKNVTAKTGSEVTDANCFQKTFLDYLYHAFDKFATFDFFSNEPKMLDVACVLPCDTKGSFFDKYITHIKRRLEECSGKDCNNLFNSVKNIMKDKLKDHLHEIIHSNEGRESEICALDWIEKVVCLIPIQLARAVNNSIAINQDKGSIPSAGAVHEISDAIDFGLYERLIKQWKGPIKVLSSMGKQSTGKSYFLNHLSGSHFDISGARCTEGVWMTFRKSKDCLLILLDFEGLGSIERSSQEDMLLSVINAAISGITCFKMESRIDAETIEMWKAFRDGVDLIHGNDNLLKGWFYILIKDVPDRDREEMGNEFFRKIEFICKHDEENFFKKLYNGQVCVFPFPMIGQSEFYKAIGDIDADVKDDSTCFSFSCGNEFMKTLKILLAKIQIKDWGNFDQALIKGEIQQLSNQLMPALHIGQLSESEEDFLPDINDEEIPDLPNACCGMANKPHWYPKDAGLLLMLDTADNIKESKVLKIFKENKKKMGSNEHPKAWFLGLKEFTKFLCLRRRERVMEWIEIHTERFKDEPDVKTFKVEAKNLLAMQERNWELCGNSCSLCLRKCLLKMYHDGDDHDCLTGHKCSEGCDFCLKSAQQQSDPEFDMENSTTCPNNHEMTLLRVSEQLCEKCNEPQPLKTFVYSCAGCKFNVCIPCFDDVQANLKQCPNHHELQLCKMSDITCDTCNQCQPVGSYIYKCDECKFNHCCPCVDNQEGKAVYANFMGMGYRRGKILRKNQDGTCDIQYEFGAREVCVPLSQIRPANKAKVCKQPAGHNGKHNCGSPDHTCGEKCIHFGKRQCREVCSKLPEHHKEGDETHSCGATHLCGEPCALPTCTKKCCISIDVVHGESGQDPHCCEDIGCPEDCKLDCNRKCSSTANHFHSIEVDALLFKINPNESKIIAEEKVNLATLSLEILKRTFSDSNVRSMLRSEDFTNSFEELDALLVLQPESKMHVLAKIQLLLKETGFIKHFCGLKHTCPEECEKPGNCEITCNLVTTESQCKYTNRYGTFVYEQYSAQNGRKLKCCKDIEPYQESHPGEHVHSTDEQVHHYCEERCPACHYYCTKKKDHNGRHHTNHGNMRNAKFVCKGDRVTIGERVYAADDIGEAEMCPMYCNKLGRGHFHIKYCTSTAMECECEDGVRHARTRYEPDKHLEKDELTHKAYWKDINFKDPNPQDRVAEFMLCNSYCPHQSHKDDKKSYCCGDVMHPNFDEQGTNLPDNLRSIEDGTITTDGHFLRCTHGNPHHILFVVDFSYSMNSRNRVPSDNRFQKNRLGAVFEACYMFVQARLASCCDDRISLICFNNKSRNIFENQPLSTHLIFDANANHGPRGNTNYSTGLKAAFELMHKVDSNAANNVLLDPIVIFLSDGEDGGPDFTNDMQIWLRNRARDGKPQTRFVTVMFADRMSNRVQRIVSVAREFENGNEPHPSQCHQTLDTVQLQTTFLNVAKTLDFEGGLINLEQT